MKKFDSFVDAFNDLKKRGYDADFEPQSNCLYCSNLDLRLNEEEFHLDEVYRFEGNSTPQDKAVIYAFTSPSGVKGTVVANEASLDNSSFESGKEAAKPSAVAG